MVDRISGLVGDLGVKAPVRAYAATNITLSGLQTVDGVVLAADDRVLVGGQTSNIDNGIYSASTGAWTRTPDCDGARDLMGGTAVYVVSGTAYAGTFFAFGGNGALTPGVSPLPVALSLSSVSTAMAFVQSGVGVVARTVQSKGRDSVSLFDFGAVGDGVTDDTVAIQAAIDAHDYVKIPEEHTFLFSKLTINRGNITLFGGGQSSLLKTTAAANIAIAVASTANVEVTRFRDFRLQGNATNIGGIALGTTAFYTAYTELDNVRVDGFTNASNGYGLVANSVQELYLNNTRLQGNYFNFYRPNVVGFMTSTLISGSTSYYGLAINIGIYINGPFSELNISEGVVIEGNGNEGILVSGYSGHIYLNGCYFEGNATNGTGAVSVSGGAGAYGQAKLTAKGCDFHANANAAKPQLYLDYVVGSEISNCDGLFSDGGIATTAHSSVHFSNNKSAGAADILTAYKALPGVVSFDDFHTDGVHFNYGRRVAFPATATFSTDKNTIDDAKRGTFTPTANIVTFAQATGAYTKIWDLVVMHFSVQWPATADASSAQITNCPYNGSFGGLSVRFTDSALTIVGTVSSSGVLGFFNTSGVAYTNANLSGKWIQGTVTYQEYNHP